ncbi:anti-sigma factor antagonist [Streptomyces soliscabiei]|uniref:anti-sigma factor antagonist n=1 Tax=Streptomyces soliscabiei TaxID=588897 RepID=UPI0029B2D681|nr:anti-sigma factor antagonist [Streptomyces sp. NY05-11A]MDX2680620.1 anti-sigma factor antagonist [Streptomyces sp. NY05-11A]
MTIEWRYTIEEDPDVGVLSVDGYLGPDAVHRFSGAVDWVAVRCTGPVIVNLAELRAWSAEGRRAVAEAARRLAADGRSLELAAIPSRGVLLSDEDCPDIPVHPDLPTALAAHAACRPAMAAGDSAPPADLPDR